jgi:hypothetical protein
VYKYEIIDTFVLGFILYNFNLYHDESKLLGSRTNVRVDLYESEKSIRSSSIMTKKYIEWLIVITYYLFDSNINCVLQKSERCNE